MEENAFAEKRQWWSGVLWIGFPLPPEMFLPILQETFSLWRFLEKYLYR
jgi:hypothetical protein